MKKFNRTDIDVLGQIKLDILKLEEINKSIGEIDFLAKTILADMNNNEVELLFTAVCQAKPSEPLDEEEMMKCQIELSNQVNSKFAYFKPILTSLLGATPTTLSYSPAQALPREILNLSIKPNLSLQLLGILMEKTKFEKRLIEERLAVAQYNFSINKVDVILK